MSGKRWKDPTQEPPDPRRKKYFEEWVSEHGINALGVSLGKYIELRMAGEWNEFADARLRGRFKVEGEG